MDARNKHPLCRLCLHDDRRLFYIFQKHPGQKYYPAKVIKDVLQMQVSETDRYPRFVCLICFDKLTDISQFRERCRKSMVIYDSLLTQESSHQADPQEKQTNSAYSDVCEEVLLGEDPPDGGSAASGECEEVLGEEDQPESIVKGPYLHPESQSLTSAVDIKFKMGKSSRQSNVNQTAKGYNKRKVDGVKAYAACSAASTGRKTEKMTRRKSDLWNHFSEEDVGKAKCGYCSKIISIAGGSQGNLNRHLKKKHPTVILSKKQKPLELLPSQRTDTDRIEQEHSVDDEQVDDPPPTCVTLTTIFPSTSSTNLSQTNLSEFLKSKFL